MSSDEHNYIQNLLKEILSNVNNWLIFAEAKNAAIITFDLAVIASIAGIDFFRNNIFIFHISIIGIFFSLVIALYSFKPEGNIKKNDYDPQSELDNLIYYADIVKYNEAGYIKALSKKYLQKDIHINQVQEVELDYSKEIVYNSKIAYKKYKLFKYSLNIILITIILSIIIIVYNSILLDIIYDFS